MGEKQTKIEIGDWTIKYRGVRVRLFHYSTMVVDFHESELPPLMKALRAIQAAIRKKRSRP